MADLKSYGFDAELIPPDIDGIPARVTAVHKERYELICEYGKVFGRLKAGIYFGDSKESFPTTGDFVLLQHNLSGDSQIVKTLQRKSKFSRNDFSGHAAGYVKTVKEQVVAANFDYVFVMVSLNHDFNLKRVERFLTLSWQSGAVPVVVLTKSDLVDDCAQKVLEAEQVAAGAEVIAVSAKTGDGIDRLSGYLKPRSTIVFLGSSGVGKSSLVNALAEEEIMGVNEIREDDSRGRHTTTHRQLIMLPCGAMVIDTPGMREIGMWDADAGLSEAFADVESYFGRCRFSDCRHESEPGCAVKRAIAEGELSEERWESYLQIRREARFAEDKAAYLREKNARFKSVTMWYRKNIKNGKP